MNALVLDYLVVEGYRDAAEEFLRETSQRGSDAPSSHAFSSDDGESDSDEDELEDDDLGASGSLRDSAGELGRKLDLGGIEVSPHPPVLSPAARRLLPLHDLNETPLPSSALYREPSRATRL